jgi:hypothetical protein
MIQLFHVMCAVNSDDSVPLFWNYVVEELSDVFACVVREIARYAGDTSSYDPAFLLGEPPASQKSPETPEGSSMPEGA